MKRLEEMLRICELGFFFFFFGCFDWLVFVRCWGIVSCTKKGKGKIGF